MRKHILMLSLLLPGFLNSTTVVAQKEVKNWPNGITYEIFVQSFCDSNGDGKGDIKGMTSKLDYLKDLGIQRIWLMPINPSPSYHKYDVKDYYGIDPSYGTIDDFKNFIKEAHKRNIKVIIDLVINHSSKQHPWFTDAVTNPKSPYWDYYVWTHKDDPQTIRVVTKTGEDSRNRNRWNKVDGSNYMYYSYFGGHMPDLNFDSPKLREEIFKMGRYWLQEIDIDGFRLDAAKHIFPDERASESQKWWEYFLSEMKKVKKDVYIVGEVWSSTDKVAPFLKGIPSLFNFDLASAIKKAVNEEKGDSLANHNKSMLEYYKQVNADFVDATFLANHDQNRIMSSVDNDINKAKMAAALLLTLPGSPYLYYGEEIGMKGKKPDEYIREPFLWDVSLKDKSRTKWIIPKYNNDTTILSLAHQTADKSSFFNCYKTLIALRNESKALTLGTLEPVYFGFKEVSSFQRIFEDENLLVIHNLSKADVTITLPDLLKGYNKIKFKTKNNKLVNNTVILPAYSTVILKNNQSTTSSAL